MKKTMFFHKSSMLLKGKGKGCSAYDSEGKVWFIRSEKEIPLVWDEVRMSGKIITSLI